MLCGADSGRGHSGHPQCWARQPSAPFSWSPCVTIMHISSICDFLLTKWPLQMDISSVPKLIFTAYSGAMRWVWTTSMLFPSPGNVGENWDLVQIYHLFISPLSPELTVSGTSLRFLPSNYIQEIANLFHLSETPYFSRYPFILPSFPFFTHPWEEVRISIPPSI